MPTLVVGMLKTQRTPSHAHGKRGHGTELSEKRGIVHERH
jgi:hypothetical protein